jgi:caa(3)-type oxidase subunit IV
MSDSEKPVSLQSYYRLCTIIFIAIICAVGCMIGASFLLPFGWPAKVAVILGIAAVNAFLVASYLMHLLSEKKMVYTVLSFTVFFVIGLFGLTLWAMNNFPLHTATH